MYLFAGVFIPNTVKYTAVGLLIRALQSFTFPSTEASVLRRSSQKVFLKISQHSQESNCVGLKLSCFLQNFNYLIGRKKVGKK